jgi:hypothetical protein
MTQEQLIDTRYSHRLPWQEKGHTYHFDGPTYRRHRDGVRLSTQLDKVREWALEWSNLQNRRFWRLGGANHWAWFTLEQIATATGYPPASIPSISSALRDMRKPRHGKFLLLARFRERGLWEYLLIPPELEDQLSASMRACNTATGPRHK